MRVGFFGGSSVCELGSVADVIAFFACLERYAVDQSSRDSWWVLTDRLYKRYLRPEEVPAAISLMAKAKEDFSLVGASSVDWAALGIDIANTTLSLTAKNLAEVFEKFFEHFSYCVESSALFEKTWGKLAPVRLVCSDIPEFFTDKRRPLTSYDSDAAEPFWQRHRQA
ncbi:MAG: hypothetical protein ACTHJ9_09300 [Rhodanobacter sp.]